MRSDYKVYRYDRLDAPVVTAVFFWPLTTCR